MAIVRPRAGLAAVATNGARRLVSILALMVAVSALPAVVAGQSPRSPQPPPQHVPKLPPPPPPVADSGEEEEEAPQTDPMDDLEWREPPDGKWIPAEDGREYFITRLKKDPTHQNYYRPDEKRIIYKRLYPFEVDHEDDEYFYLRYYRLA